MSCCHQKRHCHERHCCRPVIVPVKEGSSKLCGVLVAVALLAFLGNNNNRKGNENTNIININGLDDDYEYD